MKTVLLSIIILFFCFVVCQRVDRITEQPKKIIIKYELTWHKESEDTIHIFKITPQMLSELKIKLIGREGISLKPYLLSGYYYIYWGHLCKQNEKYNGTFQEADSILNNDVNKCIWEVYRLIHAKRMELIQNSYSMFISGKL